MPPTGANAKVKDPEYCNWLKVGLALYYLKDGISSFIQDEVDAMHKFILRKLYNASTVPAPLCSSCNAKDVKQNRNGYTWKFKSPCPISVCDTWLTELLALCTNPTSSKLYCENCDVTAWPKTPWECAKFYMPRGQTVNNTGPAQSDSQALLTLMANCKYLNSKLSPGGIQLTNMVSKIKNTVMHSGDMRLSDKERTGFITDIIKLLEDPCHLKSLDECKKAVLEINKINTDSLEVFFNTDMEMEMKALSACVNEFRQELGVHLSESEKNIRQELGVHIRGDRKTTEDLTTVERQMPDNVETSRSDTGLEREVEKESSVEGNEIHPFNPVEPIKDPEAEEVLPPEILNMGESFQKLYRDALSTGNEKDYSIRVMIVGREGAGKTSLTQRLLGEQVAENETESTEGIDVHTRCCQIDHATGEWKRSIRRDELFLNDQRIASIVHKYKRPQDHQDINVTDTENDTIPAKKRRLSLRDQTSVPLSVDAGQGNSVEDASVSQIANEASNLTESDSAVTNIHLDNNGQTGNGLDESERGIDTKEIQTFLERAPSLIIPKRMSSDVTLLDFAGQSVFYTTHQAFMSWRTLYLLVTDMSLPLTDAVKEGTHGTDVSGSKTCSIQDNISYWLNSVHSHVRIPEDHRIQREEKKPRIEDSSGCVQATTMNHPFVILVGTHLDKIPKDLLEKRKKSYFNDIRNHLKNSPLMLHLVDEDFAISNLGSDLNINALKSKIFEIAQKHVCWGTNIPARWIPLEKALMELKNEGIPVMDYADVKRINETRQVKIEWPEEFDLFLMFEHDIGNIVFFPTERLRKKVVLDPEWLIHGVRIWITTDKVTTRDPELLEQWFTFKDTGRLTSTLIEMLWSSHSGIHQHREHLLDVMEELSIIAKPLKLTEEKYYWVPCMVSVPAPDDVKKLQQNKDTTKTSTLCFRSKANFIHVGVFHRLLATCLSKWAPAKYGNKYLLFRGLCVFDLDEQQQLILSLNDFVIHATVIRFTKKGRIPDLPLCMTIRDILNSALSEISDCLCPGSEFEICIKCMESSPLSNEGLHSIATLRAKDELKCSTHAHNEAHCVESVELLGFWEEGTKLTPPNVLPMQMQAKERFTRVFSLLVDVGSKVLRKVLIYYTTTSHCTMDQYMKKKEPDILDLKKKKVLKKRQVDIIFPQSGQTDVNTYDITLASALLNNICPSLCPQEKKRISDLRTERNNLAHSQSTMMNEQDFQTKWTDITTILTDLCKLCKDPNFDKEIQKEIQDIQLSGSDAIISKWKKMKEKLKQMCEELDGI